MSPTRRPRLRLPIQDPCHEDWGAMRDGGDGKRFCEVCTKDVHDLSSMTEPEARHALVEARKRGSVCVRYRMNPATGDIRFATETTTAWASLAAAASMALMLLSGCTSREPDAIHDDKCVYEVGPWSVELARGEGTCPAAEVEVEIEDAVVMGKEAVDPIDDPPVHEVVEMGEAPIEEPPVVDEVPCDEPGADLPVKGKIKAKDLDEIAVQGQAPAPDPEVEVMGDLL